LHKENQGKSKKRLCLPPKHSEMEIKLFLLIFHKLLDCFDLRVNENGRELFCVKHQRMKSSPQH